MTSINPSSGSSYVGHGPSARDDLGATDAQLVELSDFGLKEIKVVGNLMTVSWGEDVRLSVNLNTQTMFDANDTKGAHFIREINRISSPNELIKLSLQTDLIPTQAVEGLLAKMREITKVAVSTQHRLALGTTTASPRQPLSASLRPQLSEGPSALLSASLHPKKPNSGSPPSKMGDSPLYTTQTRSKIPGGIPGLDPDAEIHETDNGEKLKLILQKMKNIASVNCKTLPAFRVLEHNTTALLAQIVHIESAVVKATTHNPELKKNLEDIQKSYKANRELIKLLDDKFKEIITTTFIAKENAGGGDCLFHSFADMIASYVSKPLDSMQIRRLIVNQFIKHPMRYKNDILQSLSGIEHELGLSPGEVTTLINKKELPPDVLNRYIAHISKSGTWGGDAEVRAFADLVGRPITKVYANAGQLTEMRDLFEATTDLKEEGIKFEKGISLPPFVLQNQVNQIVQGKENMQGLHFVAMLPKVSA